MLPVDCPSCGKSFADIDIPWTDGQESIDQDANLTRQEKQETKAKLLATLGFVNYCCRMRALGAINEIHLIK